MKLNILDRFRRQETAIKEACDNLPIGICLATSGGVPRLTNHIMQELVSEITHGHLANALVFWQELSDFQKNDLCEKIDFTENPTIYFTDGKIYSFSKRGIQIQEQDAIEILATDITEQYSLTQELERENATLRDQTKQLNDLMKDIASINRDEEVLESKMRVHYEMGRVVLASHRFLSGEMHLDKDELLEMWDDVLLGLENPLFSEKESFDFWEEICSMMKNGGCNVTYHGEMNTDDDMVISLIREGMVNAVRHGHATNVHVEGTVENRDNKKFCEITITDDGVGIDDEIHKGGLNSLCDKLAERNGELKLYNNPAGKGTVLEACWEE